MRVLVFILLLSTLGCYTDRHIMSYRMTQSGYAAVHRNDYVSRNMIYQYHRDGENYCTHKCHHIKEPVYRYVFVPPIYKPIFLGVDNEGRDIYERMLILGGHYKKVFVGYHCYLCGAKL